jgi:capsular exopolysaccharide synthesis family protein
MPRLDVLLSGVIPPNPVALLDSKRMALLMETFSKNYDFVIVDTPPLAGMADAPILGKMADGILLVVRPSVVDATSAKAAKEFLARSGQNVLGLVANGVILKNEPDSYFYYTKEDYTTPDFVREEQAELNAGRQSARS